VLVVLEQLVEGDCRHHPVQVLGSQRVGWMNIHPSSMAMT
jgi:hypothetical protein